MVACFDVWLHHATSAVTLQKREMAKFSEYSIALGVRIPRRMVGIV